MIAAQCPALLSAAWGRGVVTKHTLDRYSGEKMVPKYLVAFTISPFYTTYHHALVSLLSVGSRYLDTVLLHNLIDVMSLCPLRQCGYAAPGSGLSTEDEQCCCCHAAMLPLLL